MNKAYGPKEIPKYIIEQEAEYTIPSKSNTKNKWEYKYNKYKKRNLVERFFNKIKRFRKIATRYDKLTSSFMSFIYIASISILFK